MSEYYDERYRKNKKRDRKGEGPISRYKRKMRGSIDAAEGGQPQALAFKARERLTPTAKQAWG